MIWKKLFLIADEVLWYEHCENTPGSAEQSTQHFGELANALQILHHYKQGWTEDDVISIIDEITSKWVKMDKKLYSCITDWDLHEPDRGYHL